MTLAPLWLQRVSDANPLKHIIDGVRAMFRGDLGSSTSLWGIALTLLLVIGGLMVGTRVFQRESA